MVIKIEYYFIELYFDLLEMEIKKKYSVIVMVKYNYFESYD